MLFWDDRSLDGLVVVVDKAALMHSGPPPETGAEDEVRAPKELFILLLLFVLMKSWKEGEMVG